MKWYQNMDKKYRYKLFYLLPSVSQSTKSVSQSIKSVSHSQSVRHRHRKRHSKETRTEKLKNIQPDHLLTPMPKIMNKMMRTFFHQRLLAKVRLVVLKVTAWKRRQTSELNTIQNKHRYLLLHVKYVVFQPFSDGPYVKMLSLGWAS